MFAVTQNRLHTLHHYCSFLHKAFLLPLNLDAWSSGLINFLPINYCTFVDVHCYNESVASLIHAVFGWPVCSGGHSCRCDICFAFSDQKIGIYFYNLTYFNLLHNFISRRSSKIVGLQLDSYWGYIRHRHMLLEMHWSLFWDVNRGRMQIYATLSTHCFMLIYQIKFQCNILKFVVVFWENVKTLGCYECFCKAA